MKYSFKTDKGLKRLHNEDCCAVFMPDEKSCFAVVCDGMGGASAGDKASSMAVETIVERIKNGWRSDMSEDSMINLLLTTITAANIFVYDFSLSDEKYNGMGTTVVACLLTGNRAIIAHAGDSRAYFFDKDIIQITKDHSVVQDLLDKGQITTEQANYHPQKNYITRALGVDENIDIDFNSVDLTENSKILLCSDGLTNYLTDEEIFAIIKSEDDPAESLVREANFNGGGDNITAVVISIN
ncbi:MAG: Stp1/IreP family PP2C-type Ser/Thr phosphatase [Oscillospiraceae bacterium]|nr:Stp1/IreP family PP2C-type Ser/Thr phosphatase [Oscillospiraceae bacterium]